MSTTMTTRLEPELKNRLNQLAEATHRSKSFLAAESIRDFLELNEWQVQEVEINAFNGSGTERAENTAKIFQVERLIKPDIVVQNQHLVFSTTSDFRPCQQAYAGTSRKMVSHS